MSLCYAYNIEAVPVSQTDCVCMLCVNTTNKMSDTKVKKTKYYFDIKNEIIMCDILGLALKYRTVVEVDE